MPIADLTAAFEKERAETFKLHQEVVAAQKRLEEANRVLRNAQAVANDRQVRFDRLSKRLDSVGSAIRYFSIKPPQPTTWELRGNAIVFDDNLLQAQINVEKGYWGGGYSRVSATLRAAEDCPLAAWWVQEGLGLPSENAEVTLATSSRVYKDRVVTVVQEAKNAFRRYALALYTKAGSYPTWMGVDELPTIGKIEMAFYPDEENATALILKYHVQGKQLYLSGTLTPGIDYPWEVFGTSYRIPSDKVMALLKGYADIRDAVKDHVVAKLTRGITRHVEYARQFEASLRRAGEAI